METIESIQKCLAGEKMNYSALPNPNNKPGIAEGILIGGNLKTLETLAGSKSDINTDGKIELIDLLPDDESNTAYAINNAGTVVGMSDDPTGGEGGPQAFIWRKGVVEPLKLLKGTVDSSAMAINQAGAIVGFMLKDAREDSSVVSFIRKLK